MAEGDWKPGDRPRNPAYRKVIDQVTFGEPGSPHWEQRKLRLQATLAEDLTEAINNFNASTTQLSGRLLNTNRWLVVLTFALVALTVVLVYLGWLAVQLR